MKREKGTSENRLRAARNCREDDPGQQEKQLVNGLRNGQESALKEVMRLYNDRLFFLSLGICGNKEDTEEVVQDVYVKLMHKIDQFESRSSLYTWLHRVTVNETLMKMRKRKRQPFLLPLMEEAVPGTHANREPMAGAVESPEERTAAHESCSRVLEEAGRLPDGYRKVFHMREILGLSIRETSKALDISVAATKSRLSRCRRFLRVACPDCAPAALSV